MNPFLRPPHALWLLSALTLCPAGRGAPQIDSFQWNGPPGSALHLTGRVPTNAVVTLQVNTNLVGGPWSDLGQPLFAPAAGGVAFDVPYESAAGGFFFRLQAVAYEVPLRDDGRQFKLTTTTPVPFGLLLEAVRRATGQNLYPVDPACADPFRLVGPLDLSAVNAEELFRLAGCAVWAVPPLSDDTNYVVRFPVNTNSQPGTPSGPNGTGMVGDGFPGVSGRPDPEVARPEPPQRPDLKPLNPNFPPAPDGSGPVEDPNRVEPGQHLRLRVDLAVNGGVTLRRVYQLPGDALLDPPLAAAAAEGGVLCVVRSATGDIASIRLFDDPFAERRYQPPDDESEHLDRGTASLRVPVPMAATETNASGLTVEFHRVIAPVPGEVLDVAAFTRYAASFQLLGVLTGSQLQAALTPLPSLGDITLPNLPPPSLTTLFRGGPIGKKYNMVIVGDGFTTNATDQARLMDWGQEAVLAQAFTRDIGPEILNAFNIFRVNLYSLESGVTRVTATNTVIAGTEKNTALGWAYSGVWDNCWFFASEAAREKREQVVDALMPDADMIIVVCNVTGSGGCAGSGRISITLGGNVGDNWPTVAHEFGHAFAIMGDEYYCTTPANKCRIFTNAEPSKLNHTTNTVRETLKWNQWIPATRPIPTLRGHITNTTEDVGLFVGATSGTTKYYAGLYRPTWNGRMNDNSPPFNPVGYAATRDGARQFQMPDFRRHAMGDFNGDGRTDLALKDGVQLGLHLAGTRDVGNPDPMTGVPPRQTNGVLKPTWFANDRINNQGLSFWRFRDHDRLVPLDFTGDGKTDLLCINFEDWGVKVIGLLRATGTNFVLENLYAAELPGWGNLGAHDEFFTGDFDGDGKDDLYVFNGEDLGGIGSFLLMLRSTGSAFEFVRRYDIALPGLTMGRHEKFSVGDLNGDGKDDLVSWNGGDFAQAQLGLFRSSGTNLVLSQRYYGSIGGGGAGGFSYWMREHDQPVLLDFNGDGRKDLALFNGQDWAVKGLATFTMTTNTTLQLAQLHVITVGPWKMAAHDLFRAGDVNGDGREDLVVLNALDWGAPEKFLGTLRSTGNGSFTGGVQNLSALYGLAVFWTGDFAVADYQGAQNWDDLFLFGIRDLTLLRSQQTGYAAETYYPKWIHNHRWHGQGWW